MSLDKLRYFLTDHIESFSLISSYKNFKLLIHPTVGRYVDLINRVEDDIKLLPEIEPTTDNTEIKFYTYNYNEQVYCKNELLAFIFASINQEWDIIKGIDITGKFHFWLKNGEVIFDPSLAVITNQEIYKRRFKQLKEIKNENVISYLTEHNNLYKFYQAEIFKIFSDKNNPNFSIDFINKIIREFNENINKQYVLDDEKIEKLKKYFSRNNYLNFRQVLTHKRVSYLQSNKIAVHPSIDEGILEVIKKGSESICDLMKNEYGIDADYYNGTIGNCYTLSIMLNLYDGDFKLVQGYIPFEEDTLTRTVKRHYQHSWLERDNIIYDPAFRTVTTKDLYYIFVQKEDEYSKEETENILRRIGVNLTHFKDFMGGKQIGNDETIRYRNLVNEMDSPECREEGEKLISYVKSLKRQ